MKLRNLPIYLIFMLFTFSLISCGGGGSSDSETTTDSSALADESEIYYSDLHDTSDWTDATHGKLDTDEIMANIDTVFDTASVQKLRIVIEAENWDTYGVMSHNYFLYHNPATDQFEWIPWDNNEALTDHARCLSLNMFSVGSDWPLIRYILDVEDYELIYKGFVEDFANYFFDGSDSDVFNVNDRYETYEALIEDYVVAEQPGYTFTSPSEFSAAVSDLIEHTTERYNAAVNYVND